MLKFLRKYNKLILVFGGSLLMVVFLLPQAIQQLGTGAGARVVATMDGRDISAAEFNAARQEYSTARTVMGSLVEFFGVESPDHWMLLTHEAERHGLVGGQGDGEAALNAFSEFVAEMNARFEANPQQREQTYETAYNNLFASLQQGVARAQNNGIPTPMINKALARMRGILRLRELYTDLPRLSKPEARLFAADLFDSAIADLAVIPASAERPDPQTLSEDALAEHFEQYKDERAGVVTEENPFGFGYRQDQAVRLEWIRVPLSALERGEDIGPIELRLFYRENQQQYLPSSFEEARDRVAADMRRERAESAAERATLAVRRKLQSAIDSLEVRRGYRVLPEDWEQTRPSLAEYADVIEEELGAEDGAVEVVEDDGEFRDRRALQQLQGVGLAQYRVNERETLRLNELVMQTRELAGVNAQALQQDLLFGPLRLPGNDLFFIRITDVREEGPPESWRTVEDRVRTDLALRRGYETIVDDAEQYRMQMVEGGLGAMLDLGIANATFQAEAIVSGNATQTPDGSTFQPAASELFREGLLQRIRNWDPTLNVSELSADERTFAVPTPNLASLVIAQVQARRPGTREDYYDNLVRIRQMAQQEASRRGGIDPFSMEALSERYNYDNLVQEDEGGA